jgi:hypothetical protein
MPNYLTIGDINKNTKLKKEILWKISIRKRDSETYMQPKRELFKYWYSKLTNPAESETDKIKIHLFFQHLKAFISTYYTEWLTAWFNWKEFMDDDYAYMLETCYINDIVTMEKKKKDFFHIMNIGFFGVSLYMKEWFDQINNTIRYSVVSPEYWLPDPHGNAMKWYEYHMFDFEISESEIEKINKESKSWDIYVWVDKYSTMLWTAEEVRNNKNSDRALWTAWLAKRFQGTRVFLEREWVKYIANVFNNGEELWSWERIMPVSDEEKKYPTLIPFPVEVVNAFPLVDDPCGIWLAELVLSFQNAKNRLMNMALRTEERASGFKVILADISKIQDIDLLAERPTDWPIIVPFNWEMWPLNGDVVRPVMDWIKSERSTLDMAWLLDMEAQSNSWFTSAQRWLPFWPDISLWEAKMQQVNSNLIFSLDSECISRWEIAFVKNMWLRWLKEFLPATKTKFARIGSGIASNEVMLNGKDIKDHWDPDITVDSRKSIWEKNKQKLDFLLAREALVMADPDIPAISKLFYKRDIEKYRGIPREEIMLKYRRTPDEERAIWYIKMINAHEDFKDNPKITREDLVPKAMFYAGMDLRTYYIYINKARKSDLRDKILNQIMELMIKEWLWWAKQPMMPWEDWGDKMSQLWNSMASQLTSNVVQQSGSVNNYPTRQDVLNP